MKQRILSAALAVAFLAVPVAGMAQETDLAKRVEQLAAELEKVKAELAAQRAEAAAPRIGAATTGAVLSKPRGVVSSFWSNASWHVTSTVKSPSYKYELSC